MQLACQNIPLELKRLREDAASLKSPELAKVSGQGGYGRGDGRLVENLARRQQLEAALRRTKGLVSSTKRALRALDPTEQMLLDWCYITPRRGRISGLCQLLGREKSAVYRRRDRALEKFTTALFGDGAVGL